jgi:AraC-like DNA-binding protein
MPPKTGIIPPMAGRVPSIRSRAVFAAGDCPLAVRRIAGHRATALHSHAFHELVLITGGTGRHLTARGACALRKGDVFLIRGAAAHGYAETRGLSLINVLFDPRRLRLPLNELDLGAVPGYHTLFQIEPRLRQAGRAGPRPGLSAAQLEGACEIVAAIEEELRARRPGCSFMACGHLIRLIGFLSRCCSATRLPRGDAMLGIGRALSHIERHFTGRIAVGELAQVARMSERTLLRRFRETLECTPIERVMRARVRHARELLRRGEDLKLAEVAARCGFADAGHFSRQFRRLTGCTPRAYRAAAGRL